MNEQDINKTIDQTQQTIKVLSPETGILNQAIRRPHSEVRRPRGDVSVRALFSFPEEFSSIHLCDVFEASFYQLSCFFEGRCSFADVVIILDRVTKGYITTSQTSNRPKGHLSP